MKSAVIVFPGSNCDRDMAVALRQASGRDPAMVWHKDASLPEGLDVIALPGGFSFGDYLRCGAIAARSPILRAVVEFANKGGLILGVCNGFQVLIEAGLLPGALMRNADLKFVCRTVGMTVGDAHSPFLQGYRPDQTVRFPVAHHDGNYIADQALLDRLEGDGRIAFRYLPGENPNGAQRDIAGIVSGNGRVLGMMPHPERAADPELGNTDGAAMFSGLVSAMETA